MKAHRSRKGALALTIAIAAGAATASAGDTAEPKEEKRRDAKEAKLAPYAGLSPAGCEGQSTGSG